MKLRDLITLLIVFFLSTVGSIYAQNNDFSEPWVLSFDERVWVIGNKQSAGNQKIIEYVLQGETVENWNELVTSFSYEVPDELGVEEVASGFITKLKQDCPTAEVNIIKEDPTNRVFEWKTNGSPGFPAQHEIKHISKVGKSIYYLSYVKKTSSLSNDERAKWISVIENAYILQETGDSFKEAWQKGDDYSKKQMYDEAISEYTKAIGIKPRDSRNAEIYCNRGRAYGQKGDSDQAISDFSKAIEINPDLAEAYYARGIAYEDKGDFEQALSDYSKTIEINPGHANAYYNRGCVYLRVRNFDQAISDYTETIELTPQSAQAYNKRGYVYTIKDEYDPAISDYSKGIELDPQVPDLYFGRAVCYFRRNEFEKSWADLHKAEELGYKVPVRFINDLKKASGREN